MAEEEDYADMAIYDLREFIDTERQLVMQEHELYYKLQSLENLLMHLAETAPENMVHLNQLNGRIIEILLEIRELIESGTLRELKILKEEEQILQQLHRDVKHREWRAVRKDIDLETQEEEQVVRLEKRELKDLHSKFIDLMKVMKRSRLISAIEEDLTVPKEKEEYEKSEEYYFLQIYKFARAYERIFRHLWRKNLILSKKIRRDSGKIE